jgi:chromosomal replication initiator protein
MLPVAPGRIKVSRVLEVTARYFGTTVPEMLARDRKRRAVRRRQLAAYVAREVSYRSLPFIADCMGGWDHTTILHHVRAVKSRLDAGDSDTIAAVNQIIAQLQVTGGAHDGN